MKKYYYTLIFVLLTFHIQHTQATPVVDAVPDAVELAALKDIYDNLGGSAWTTKTNWPTASTWPTTATSSQFGTWYGVTVTNGDISSISMHTNNVVGQIPSSISNLQALKTLMLINGQLNGTVPVSIGSLANLEILSLAANQLSGSIPSQLNNLTNLTQLNLSGNEFTGDMPNLGGLVNLTSLAIAVVPLNPGPIPAWIANLTNLEVLSLTNSRRTGAIPSFIWNLTNLKVLYLDTNTLTGSIPPSIQNLTNLLYFTAISNQLSGSIPNEIGNLTNLVTLQLHSNQLTGSLPSSLGNLSNLLYLQLNNNQLTGSIPASLGNLSNLSQLDLSNNQLTGSIPPSIGNLSNVGYLFLNNNKLTGSIPSTLGNLAKLGYLFLNANQLTGEIPDMFSNLIGLYNLQLNDNKLTGPLPPSLGSCTGLAYLTLTRNELSGSLPSSYQSLVNIKFFYVDSNKLTGTIPAYIGAWKSMVAFQITNNNFTGTIPVEIAECTSLASLFLAKNNFTGSIPPAILNLPLASVDFSDNNFNSVPNFSLFGNKANLYLDLKNNVLDFSQLEPLVGAGIQTLTYIPQKEINDIAKVNLVLGSPLTLPARPTGQYSSITWEKQQPNGTWSSINSSNLDATQQSYNRTTATLSDEGVYRWRMTNTTVTGVTLQSAPITVKTVEHFALDDFAFQYKYDARKRMIAKKVPGAEWVYMVYDRRDRLVMTQDGEQRKTNKWTYTKYDALNRPIITGIYTHTSTKNQEEMSALISTTNFYETYNGDNATQGYTDTVFPASSFAAANFEPLTATYYDNYQFRNTWTGSYAYTTDGLTATVTTGTYTQPANNLENNNVKGLVTGSKVKVLDSNPSGTWLKTITYYDDKYRVVQNQSDNLKGGVDRTSSLYDFVGKVLKTKTTHVTTAITQTIARSHDYDHAGRLLKTWHSVNSQTPVVLAANEYNELGQLVAKKLYNTDPASTADAQRAFKQNVDYRYNIRGWLNSINDVSAPEVSDLFSMNLNYNTPTANGGVAQYNGNISEILWKGPDARVNSYGYSYDPMNRLKEAKYYNATTPTQNNRFNEKIWDNINDQSGYDLNGNIKFLSRRGKTGVAGGVTTYGDMDNLSYAYSGNQLLKVSDGDAKKEGFIDGANLDNDYAYDANGNMNVDKNKSITGISTSAGNSNITYNYLNLPEKVVKSTGDYVKYTYDATGRKLKQEVYSPSSVLKKKTDYAGEFFYENDTLKFINHEEGRITMTGAPEYQYNLKDHLGNVRVTFTTKANEVETNTATVETATLNQERSKFLNIDKARRINSALFDHTYNGQIRPTEGVFAVRLSGKGPDGNTREKYGLARTLAVMPGDKIDLEVHAKYVNLSNPQLAGVVENLIAAIAQGGSTMPGTVIDGAGYAANTATSFAYGGLLDKSSETATGPKAYLNYLVFDKDFNFILAKSGYKRVSTAAEEDGTTITPLNDEGSLHELLEASIDITEAGYVYIYLSNEEEGCVEVYFDDFNVTQTKSPVIASQDYYPFGLAFNLSSRENIVVNRWKFQGQEHIDDLDLGWDSFKWRNQMPDIGRFFNVDPMASAFYYNSPYAFSENKVTTHVELEGLEAFFIHGSEQSNKIWTADLVNFIKTELTFNKTVNVGYGWDFQLGPTKRNWLLNSKKARKTSAKGLVMYIMRNKNDKEPITLIGHSHGGNVAIQAAKLLWEQYQISVDIINHNTPAFNGFDDDENPENNFGINTLSHYYTEGDGIVGLAAMQGADRKYTSPQPNVKNILLTNPLESGPFDSHMIWNMNQSEVKEKKPELKKMDPGGKHHEFVQDW